MTLAHQDPLVWNAFAGEWQNASNAGPSGSAIGMSIGDPAGSQVSLIPAAGQTVRVDGHAVLGVINAALEMASNAGSETVPGYSASITFNEGSPGEAIGVLTVSAVASGAAQATLMVSPAADASAVGYTAVGTVAPGTGGITWVFTTSTRTTPSAGTIRTAKNYVLTAADPNNGAIDEFWHVFNGLQNGWSGNISHILIPTGVGGLVVLAWFITPGAVADGTMLTTFGNAYAPASGQRVAGVSDGIKSVNAQLETPHLRITSGGDVQVFGISQGATFFAGNGLYALNPGF